MPLTLRDSVLAHYEQQASQKLGIVGPALGLLVNIFQTRRTAHQDLVAFVEIQRGLVEEHLSGFLSGECYDAVLQAKEKF